jgi:hypothetical protein
VSDLTFLSWQRSPMYDLVTDPTPKDGRLVGSLPLTLRDLRSADVGTGAVPFHLASARDVAALGPGAVLGVAPRPMARDAETTKFAHIDFRDPDLPWRYTPAKAAADRLPPWLAVLVGTAAELRLDGSTVAVLQPSVLAGHPLADSHRWAHVQDDGHRRTSRLLSPRPLEPETEYLAAVVPAFDDAGQPAWDPGAGRQPAALPVLHSWRFWTTEEGDFETLAAQIMPRSVGRLGRAPLAYRRGEVHADTEVRGAITTLGTDADGEPEAAARADLAAFVAAVRALADPLGRAVVALPRYGRPWVADLDGTRWAATLNADPRFRGTAGLGLWMGLAAQDELVDAAARQLGGINLAGHLVGQLALGLAAARSLWRRRLPDDPLRRLDTLAPLLRRLRTPTGTAMGAVAGGGSPLEAALFSSAARRMLRRGAAWTRHAAAGAASRPALVAAANRCPPPAARPGGLPHVDAVAGSLGLPPAAELPPGIVRDPPPIDGGHRLDVDSFRDLLDRALRPAEPPPCSPPDLGRIVDAVAAAVDPHGAEPPALRRVRARISGIDPGDLGPPEVPVGLDFPTWTLLRDRAKEWILPGIGTLQKHSVVAMQTNPAFIDAYLVGLNTQLQNEMHWRNMPVDRRGTPLRMFWRHIDFATGQPEAEIRPLASWAAGSELGDLDHQVLQPGDATGKRDLVIVFRTDLFRRYPATMVYLARPAGPAVADVDGVLKATPDFGYAPADKANRQFLGPIFQGALAPDVVFFAFDVDPSTLDQYWLVLDEPPSQLRFRRVDAAGAPLGGAAAAAARFAADTIDTPTRVGISGSYLESKGLELQ